MIIEMANGRIEERIMTGIFPFTSVFVRSETRSALVETGEHLSPKNTPDSTAPPASTGLIPMDSAIVMDITPTVAALPKEVPVRKDIRQLIRKTAPRNHSGRIPGRA